MSIITKTGDRGQTKLMYGAQISKGDERVEAYGTIDELNAFLGVARAQCDDMATRDLLEQLQRETFIVAAELATPEAQLERLTERVTAAMTARLEEHAAVIEALPNLLADWSVPGATAFGAAIDVARTVTRRAERCAVRLAQTEGLPNEEVLRYLNRLSDLLWLIGRRHELARDVNSALRTA